VRRLGRLASPSLQAEMAAWWEAAVVDPDDIFAGFSVADPLVLLHGGGPLERPWRSALPAEFHGRPQPELVRLLGGPSATTRYRPKLEATIDWLVSQGRYRWGWLVPLSIGGCLLVALLLVGLVFSAVITAEAGYAVLTVPFLVVTGVATTWDIGAGTVKLIRQDRRNAAAS
jgi:hypothetical protein